MYYYKTSKILCVQWNDSKVVTVLSTAWLKGSVDIQRRVGCNIRSFSTDEKCVLHYQQILLGIDKSDQHCIQAGGFRNSVRPNKWFKAGIFGLFDFATTNASIAWNMRAMEHPGSLNVLKNQSELLHCLMGDFLACKEEDFLEPQHHHEQHNYESNNITQITSPSTTVLCTSTQPTMSSVSSASCTTIGQQCNHKASHIENNKRNYYKVC